MLRTFTVLLHLNNVLVETLRQFIPYAGLPRVIKSLYFVFCRFKVLEFARISFWSLEKNYESEMRI